MTPTMNRTPPTIPLPDVPVQEVDHFSLMKSLKNTSIGIRNKIRVFQTKFKKSKFVVPDDNEEIIWMLKAYYDRSLFEDPGVIEDAYEPELKYLACDKDMMMLLFDLKKFQRTTQALRLRYASKMDTVAVHVILMLCDGFKKNRLNSLKNRQRPEFEPQGFADILTSLKMQHNVAPEVELKIDQLSEMFREAIKTVSDTATTVSSDYNDVFSKLVDLPVVLGIISTGILTMRTKEKSWLAAFAMFTTYYSYNHSEEVKTIATQIHKFVLDRFEQTEEIQMDSIEPQGFDTAPSFVSLAFALTSLVTMKEVPNKNWSSAFVKNFGQIPRIADGLAVCISTAINLMTQAMVFLKSKITDSPGLDWLSKTIPEVDSWAVKVEAIADEAHNGKLGLTSINRDRLYRLEMESAELSSKVHTGVEGFRVKSTIQAYGQILRKLMRPFAHMSLDKAAFRMEPVSMMLRGAPGVGKTWVINHLIVELLGRTLPLEELPAFQANYKTFVYNRAPETEYWDDYEGQAFCVMDDAFQARDMIGKPTEPLEFIRCINNHPYNLHMAAIENKGNVQFRSRFVLASTNMYTFKPESIFSVEALMRRFHFIVDVVPKKEYCTPETRDCKTYKDRRLNHDDVRLRDEFGKIRFNADIYEFVEVHFHDLKNNPQSFSYGKVRDFRQFIDLITETYHNKCEISDLYLGDVATRISQIVEERNIVPQGLEKLRFADHLNSKIESKFDDQFALHFKDAHLLKRLDSLISSRSEMKFMGYKAILEHIGCVQEDAYVEIVNGHLLPENVDIMKFTFYLELVLGEEEFSDDFLAKLRPKIFPGMDQFLVEARKFKDELYEDFEKLKRFVLQKMEQYPLISLSLKFLGFASVALMLYRMFKPSQEFEMESYKHKERTGEIKVSKAASSGTFVAEGYKHKERTGEIKTKPVASSAFVAEAGGDQNNFEVCRALIRKSTYSLFFPDIEGRVGVITVLAGRVAIIPFHYIGLIRNRIQCGAFDEKSELRVKNEFQQMNQSIPIKNILDFKQTQALKERDLCVFILPDHFHQHTDLTKRFVSFENIEKSLDFKCTLSIPDEDFFTRERVNCHPMKNVRVVDRSGDAPEVWYITSAFSYECNTKKGDCGAVLSIDDKAVGPGKICGIHVAGNNTGTGISAAICRENVEEILTCYQSLGQYQYPPSEGIIGMEPQSLSSPAPGSFIPYGKLPTAIYSSPKSKIARSKVYGMWGPAKTSPARLRKFISDGVCIDPRVNAISRYGGIPSTKVDPLIAQACVDSLFSRFMRVTNMGSRHRPHVFSFEDAILGRPGVAFCDSIPRNTSAGYPHVLSPKAEFPGKSWYFGLGDDYDLLRPQCLELRKDVEQVIELARKGVRSSHVFVDTLKDERLIHSKVEIGKTRLVSAAPLVLTIATRMYFLDFSMFLMENRIRCHTAPGVNPYSEEWDLLSKMLLSKGDNIIAGDFSGYDSRQLTMVLMKICGAINVWYNDGEENAMIRTTLFQEVVNSIHVSGDTIYQWVSKLPSGHPLTTILNSLQAVILVHMCWVLLHEDGLRSTELFWEKVYICSFGDDNIMSVSADSKWFNQSAIAQTMLLLNQVYTDEAKTSGSDVFFRTLGEVSFLKRSFRYDKDLKRYLAPLSLDSLLETPYWYHENKERINVQRTIIDNTILELSLHSREIFDEWAPKVLQASRDHLGWIPAARTYEQCQAQCVGLTLHW